MERPLTEHIRDGQALSLKEYEQAGGYQALRKVLSDMAPADVQQVVKDSNLRGRGGAGFPTGAKWGFVPMGDDAPRPKYLIANADEMEPGTFKDRVLLEGNPHQLLEGMILSAYAIQAEEAFVFLRWAYRAAEQRIRKAIAEAYEAGYLGENILDSGFDLKLGLHVSAGRYMCGEETGLLNALEGRRATPRSRPPFPQASGYRGQPTIVNNVETLSNVPHIVTNGADWFKSLSLTNDGGTKIYQVSGKVKRPGWWELPMGTPLREIVEEHAGGMRVGLGLRGLQPGGGSTDFLLPEHLDVKMDFQSVQDVGSRLGTGAVIVLDDQTCPVSMLLSLEIFFARESCGWCTPCREGLAWTRRILEAIERGEGEMEDLDLLQHHARMLQPGNTYCALAPGAVEPLQSALKYFRSDFEHHIREKGCPWS